MEDEIENDKGHTFIVVWDMTGLEAVIDADKLISEDVMNALKGDKGSALGRTMFVLTQRARANCHRHYEIYSIKTTADVDEEAIQDMFETSPQIAAELMRERGTKIYSDRMPKKVQVIT